MDHRLFRRRAIAINFRVFDDTSEAFLGRIGDLSPAGFMLYGPAPLAIDTLYSLRVDYHDEAGAPRSARFKAKAMWSGTDVNPDSFCTGFRFYDLEADGTRQALTELLGRFTVGNEGDGDPE